MMQKITPTIENINFEPETKCLQPGCLKSFRTSSNLEMHLRKHHNIDTELEGTVRYPSNAEFHCPIESCYYSATSVRFFRTFQLLKQHYHKVHSEKKFACTKCDKKFSRPYELKRHEAICGIDQKCSCGYSYSSHEALLTHARRYGHELPPEFQPKRKKLKINENENAGSVISSKDSASQVVPSVNCPVVADNSLKRQSKIMPKPVSMNCLPLPIVAAIALSELSASSVIPLITGKATTSTQTIVNCQSKQPKTSKVKRSRNSTQTQTMAVPCMAKSPKSSPNKLTRSRRKRVTCESTESQTNLSSLSKNERHTKNQKPIWECLDKDEMEPLHVSTDVMLSDSNLLKNSSATQTSPRISESQPHSFSQICSNEAISQSSQLMLDNLLENAVSCRNYNTNVETQTDSSFDEFLPIDNYLLGSESTGQTLNSETQTTENFIDTLNCSQLFTNMETQTGDSLFSLGLSFSTIHTQTPWDESFGCSIGENHNKLTSAETQTNEHLIAPNTACPDVCL